MDSNYWTRAALQWPIHPGCPDAPVQASDSDWSVVTLPFNSPSPVCSWMSVISPTVRGGRSPPLLLAELLSGWVAAWLIRVGSSSSLLEMDQ